MTRQKKTPRQRAEEALAIADRKVKRLTAERDKHRGALNAIESELEEETKRRDYLNLNPDLPRNVDSTSPSPTTEKSPTT